MSPKPYIAAYGKAYVLRRFRESYFNELHHRKLPLHSLVVDWHISVHPANTSYSSRESPRRLFGHVSRIFPIPPKTTTMSIPNEALQKVCPTIASCVMLLLGFDFLFLLPIASG